MEKIYATLVAPHEIAMNVDNIDFLNSTGERDICNTNIRDYNCFGFAFQNFVWGGPIWCEPNFNRMVDEGYVEEAYNYNMFFYSNLNSYCYDEDETDYYYNEIWYDYTFDSEPAMQLAIDNMLAAFPDLRLINSFDELMEDEYGIAYATGGFDYHYIVYYPEVGYFHKMGSGIIERIDSLDEGFGDRYDSKIVLFAKKKTINHLNFF